MQEKLKESIIQAYPEVTHFIDYVEGDFLCYQRFIVHSGIMIAEMTKSAHSVNFYVLERTEKR